MRKKKRAASKAVKSREKVDNNNIDENLSVQQDAEDQAAAEDTQSEPIDQAEIAEQDDRPLVTTDEADEADEAADRQQQMETAAAETVATENAVAEKAAAKKAAAEKAAAEKAERKAEEKAEAAAEKRARKQAKERRKAIHALRLSDSKARKLLNMVDFGLAFHDLVRDDDGKVVDYRVREVNPAFEAIMELTTDDAIGNPASDIYGARGRAPFLKDIVESMETGESRTFEGTVKSIRGRLRFSVQPMDKNLFALLVEDASQDAKVRRRLAFLETRVKNISGERKELAATLEATRTEAEQLQQHIEALQADLAAASKEADRIAAVATKEADRTAAALLREEAKAQRFEAAVSAAKRARDELGKATSDLTAALEAKGPLS